MFNSTKQAGKSPLYLAKHSFGYEQLLQHCLWKIVSETDLIHIKQLTEMEAKVMSGLVKRKYLFTNRTSIDFVEDVLSVLNVAIDKIICQIRTLQVQSQKYDSIIAEKRKLKAGLKGLMNISEPANKYHAGSVDMHRSIKNIGLSKRTVRLLSSYGIDTLLQLQSCSLLHLSNQARVGVKTLHEIEAVLARYLIEPSVD